MSEMNKIRQQIEAGDIVWDAPGDLRLLGFQPSNKREGEYRVHVRGDLTAYVALNLLPVTRMIARVDRIVGMQRYSINARNGDELRRGIENLEAMNASR